MRRTGMPIIVIAIVTGLLFGGVVMYLTYLLYPQFRGLPTEGRTSKMNQTHQAVTFSVGAMSSLLGLFLSHGYLTKKAREARFISMD
jgi:hypothetical protein